MASNTDDHPSIPTRKEIFDACASLLDTNVLKYEVDGAQPVFIKTGRDLLGGAETQKYLHEQSMRDPSGAPRLPEVYDSFEIGRVGFRSAREYVVMEYVVAPTVEYWLETKPEMTEWLYNKVAESVRWILDCPLPPEPRFGPVSRGPAQHRVFADHVAPLEFDSVDAVQRYFNKALDRYTPKRAERRTVDFSNEPVCFYHSDIRPSNFHYDPEIEKVTIVDLQHVGMGPKSFASYPFHVPPHVDYEFYQAIAARIEYERTENLRGMARASGYLVMCGDSSLGTPSLPSPIPLPYRSGQVWSSEA